MISTFAGNAIAGIPFTANSIEIREKFGIQYGYGDWDAKIAHRVEIFLDLSLRVGIALEHVKKGTFTVEVGISNSLIMVLICVSKASIAIKEEDSKAYLWDFQKCFIDTTHEINVPFAHLTKPSHLTFLRYDLFYTPEVPDEDWPLYVNNPILKEFLREKVI